MNNEKIQNTVFNKEKFYTANIEEKVNELVALCSQEDIPMFIAICVSNDNKKTCFKKEVVTAATHNIHLKEDIIPKLIDVTLGFDTVLPSKMTDIEFD
jgi:hypothetical protein